MFEWNDSGSLGRRGKGHQEAMSPSMAIASMEFCHGADEKLTKSYWGSSNGRAGLGSHMPPVKMTEQPSPRSGASLPYPFQATL